MNYTSAQANKRLKKLTDEYVSLREKESRSREFRAAAGENVESVRPAYDYADTQRRLAELERCIRRIKHAINLFNATHTVPGFDMTIDEMLVYIPQLTRRKNKLAAHGACGGAVRPPHGPDRLLLRQLRHRGGGGRL